LRTTRRRPVTPGVPVNAPRLHAPKNAHK
jgi:hypothetical protein